MSDLKQRKSHFEIAQIFPKIKYVIAHNNVYDVTSLDHPGGLHLINACIGRDIDCFLYGGYSLETSNRLPH